MDEDQTGTPAEPVRSERSAGPGGSAGARPAPGDDPSGSEGPTKESASSSVHVRPPQQERSRRTLERLVEAAREIVMEEGVGATTVSRVVERAESSVGSFYARFDGKDDLLRYLEERVWGEARQRWNEAVSSRDWGQLELEGVIRTVVRLLVRIHVEDAGTRRRLERDPREAGHLGAEARRFHAQVEEDVGDLLLRYRDRIAHPRPERAVAVAYRWALGGIRELLARGDGERASTSGLDPEGVGEEITRGLNAYLTGGAGGAVGAGEAEDVEFFDVWQ